jgi:hypothetical protein
MRWATRAALAAATVVTLAAVPGTASARPVPTEARVGASVVLAPEVGAGVGLAPEVRVAATGAAGQAQRAVAAPVAAPVAGSCRTVGFTPRSVVVGLTPASATFRATASRCTLRHWELSIGPYDYYTYLQSPRASIGPSRNAAAGPKDVIVDTCNSDFDCTSTLLVKSFTLKRRTTWQTASVDATPEPARRGSTIALRGRLLVVNWDARRYVGYGGRSVSVEFRTATGSYSRVKTATTDSNGWVRTTVTATQTGAWRLRYGGNDVAGAATAVGDTVAVVP